MPYQLLYREGVNKNINESLKIERLTHHTIKLRKYLLCQNAHQNALVRWLELRCLAFLTGHTH